MSGGYIDPYGFSKGGGKGGSKSGGSHGGGGRGGSYVDPYGFAHSKAAKQQHQHHHGGGGFGGFLHSVAHPFEKAGHYVGEKASLAGHDIAAIPGGTYHLVREALPSKENFEHT